jgi:hypothetical protein
MQSLNLYLKLPTQQTNAVKRIHEIHLRLS